MIGCHSPIPAEACQGRIGSGSGFARTYRAISKTMCRLGSMNTDLADAYDLAAGTVSCWQTTFEAFSDSCHEGKQTFDKRVECSTVERAIGYEDTTEKLFSSEGEIIKAEYREHVPTADAGKFWLTNRRRD